MVGADTEGKELDSILVDIRKCIVEAAVLAGQASRKPKLTSPSPAVVRRP